MTSERSHTKSQKGQVILGEEFFGALYKLVHLIRMYDDNNQSVVRCANDFIHAISQCGENESDLIIQLVGDRFYLQNEKLIYRKGTANLINNMLVYFEKRKLEGLRFSTDVKDIPPAQILTFARVIDKAEKQKDPIEWFEQQLDHHNFMWVETIKVEEEIPPVTEDETVDKKDDSKTQAEILHNERKERGLRAYGYALTSLKEVAEKISSNRRAGIRKNMRVVQNMIDLIVDDEAILLGLTTVRDYDDYTYTHSVNVAVLSMCMGLRIGLSRKFIETLGVCGMFHDLGKVDIPHEILSKPGKLNDREFEEIQKHPMNSVRQILKLQAARGIKDKILLPPFEHHLKYDLTGYPHTHRQKPPSLLGRILTIVDVFDAITSPRVYRPSALSPDRAIEIMIEKSGKDFDPVLLKVFVNMLGVYPVGTLLELDTGEIGLVTGSANSSDVTRPQVVLLTPDGQGGFRNGEKISLAERDPQTGNFPRNIAKTFHPDVYGIQPAEYIL